MSPQPRAAASGKQPIPRSRNAESSGLPPSTGPPLPESPSVFSKRRIAPRAHSAAIEQPLTNRLHLGCRLLPAELFGAPPRGFAESAPSLLVVQQQAHSLSEREA